MALHHTKIHAVFTLTADRKVLKDGVQLTSLTGGSGSRFDYGFIETDIYKPGDGNTYRLRIFECGRTELWLTTLTRYRDGSDNPDWPGGKDTKLITRKIVYHKD
jgi:hypothetical protein